MAYENIPHTFRRHRFSRPRPAPDRVHHPRRMRDVSIATPCGAISLRTSGWSLSNFTIQNVCSGGSAFHNSGSYPPRTSAVSLRSSSAQRGEHSIEEDTLRYVSLSRRTRIALPDYSPSQEAAGGFLCPEYQGHNTFSTRITPPTTTADTPRNVALNDTHAAHEIPSSTKSTPSKTILRTRIGVLSFNPPKGYCITL